MGLTQDERDVLTLLNDCCKKTAVHDLQRHIELSAARIHDIIAALEKQRYIEVLELSGKGDDWYFHTSKVTPDLLNDELRVPPPQHHNPHER
ncbi:MAG: hypothetical protein HC945_04505 [Nitrosarchaeum sp.]|nr:hypothetical protein [Nitrosarchaeum sp.]